MTKYVLIGEGITVSSSDRSIAKATLIVLGAIIGVLFAIWLVSLLLHQFI